VDHAAPAVAAELAGDETEILGSEPIDEQAARISVNAAKKTFVPLPQAD
jgi:hypothetical protein